MDEGMVMLRDLRRWSRGKGAGLSSGGPGFKIL